MRITQQTVQDRNLQQHHRHDQVGRRALIFGFDSENLLDNTKNDAARFIEEAIPHTEMSAHPRSEAKAPAKTARSEQLFSQYGCWDERTWG